MNVDKKIVNIATGAVEKTGNVEMTAKALLLRALDGAVLRDVDKDALATAERRWDMINKIKEGKGKGFSADDEAYILRLVAQSCKPSVFGQVAAALKE